MSKLTKKQSLFVQAANDNGYKNPINRADVKEIVELYGKSYGFAWPSWITADLDRRLDRGVFDVPEIDGGTLDTKSENDETVETPADEQIAQIKTVETSAVAEFTLTAGSYIPDRLKTFVPWGHFKEIESFVRSGLFAPIFITGLPGNGKTTMVEQICAKHKREFFRVNITTMTDEEDLIGGYRLIKGETVWQDGPVVHAMRRGAVLLLDEIDQATPKTMCLQPVLEGKPIFIKKINQWVEPAKGFTVLSTANTKGQGDNDGRFAGAQVLNAAFLDRIAFTYEQGYPTVATEKRIVKKIMTKHDCVDDDFADLLCRWADIIRKSFYEGSVDEIITTRRLIDAITAFKVFKDRLKSVELIIARFDDDTKEAFRSLYTKVDGGVLEDESDDEVFETLESIAKGNECPF
jgi:hypothetical protein